MESPKNNTAVNDGENTAPAHFIREMIRDDMRTGKWGYKVVTRFPPEPNGYLHIGHAKAICLSFGMAAEFGGVCHLRFDDTNPAKEEDEYIKSIKRDVRWLGFDWGEHLYFASDYFGKMHEYAVKLVEDGKAYVDDLTAEQIREYRGTLTEPGKESPFRNRPVDENLKLFAAMTRGEIAEGTCVLRAKIDMAHPNMNMRDPVMYRIMNVPHHRTGDTWKVYPMYDWAHGLEDSIEGITHSLCTLEFEDHRPLYNWFLEQLPDIHHSQQTEFARLNLNYTVMSKRKLLRLVQEKRVSGWDDPRMPTISGLRRRGYTPESIREFAERIGVAKRDSVVDIALLDFCLRDDLNKRCARVMAVLKPLKVVIENYPEDQVEELDAVNNPEDELMGTRKVPFSRVIYIEQDDFMENPPKKYYRLSPGKEVRLRYAYFITCTEVIKDSAGGIVELRCTYDPQTRGGAAPDGRSPKATIHWVSAQHAIGAEVRLYDSLFTKENPHDSPSGDFMENINPDSLKIIDGCKLEPSLRDAKAGDRYQFERLGYFCADDDSSPERLIFNRTVTLKDTWARMQKKI
ncbi:MAG: glutamine--tRNA ligase/YqeY domain fusion protein [Chitinispirillales bacterium]|jgi:glutaminyl-tRNA synthetase|nr:glutamine--tRNA ligase/YqeY domain fusion protein [Chitinispirillales bacterium]